MEQDKENNFRKEEEREPKKGRSAEEKRQKYKTGEYKM
jgi:hypothetical protein